VGPLSNPAEAEYQLIGVYSPELCPIMSRAARMLGVQRVLTVHSSDGLDELSVCAPSRLFFIDENGKETDTVFDPADLGLGPFVLEELTGGDAAENGKVAREILAGGGPEALRAAVLLNAGAALMVFGRAADLKEGYAQAEEALASGRVSLLLDRLAGKSAA